MDQSHQHASAEQTPAPEFPFLNHGRLLSKSSTCSEPRCSEAAPNYTRFSPNSSAPQPDARHWDISPHAAAAPSGLSAPWFLRRFVEKMAGWTTAPPSRHHRFPIHAVTGPAHGHAAVCMEEKLGWPQQHWLGLCFTSVSPPAEFLGLVQVCKGSSSGVLGAALNTQHEAARCPLVPQQDTEKQQS